MARVIVLFLMLCSYVVAGNAQEGPQVSTAAVPSIPAGNEQQPSPPAAKKTRVYRVWLWQETDDCLWNLAKKYYGDPRLWKKIYEANRDRISDPAVIYPKQELIIPDLDAAEK
jgi:nucleoid-associated protein YgaU